MLKTSFVQRQTNLVKNIEYLPKHKSIRKSKYAFQDVQANVDKIKSIVDTEWRERKLDWYKPIIDNVRQLFEKLLIPVAHNAVKNVVIFENALKEEMLKDLKYVKYVEKEVDDLKIEIDDLKSQVENAKTYFLKINDLLLQEFLEKDILCVTYMSMLDSNNYCDMACKYLYKIKECEQLEFELSKQNEFLKNKPTNLSKQSLENSNPRMSTSIGVIHRTSVSRPQLRSTQIKEKAVPNISQVILKKKEVEDHPRIYSFQNKMKSVSACTDSLKSKTLNAKVVCVTYGKCVVNSNHDACVSKFINDVNARTKKPKIVPISTRNLTKYANQSVTKHQKKTIALETIIQKSRSYFRMLYEKTSKAGLGGLRNNGDLVQRNVTVKRVYYVEGLNHNLFSIGQFCDADLEVAFRKSTCFVRDLQGNDLLMGTRRSDIYIITLQESSLPTPVRFMAKASPTQAWLWHRHLSHLNFNTINLLSKNDIVNSLPNLKYVKGQMCSSCELGKAKRINFKTKIPSSKGLLHLFHMDLCDLIWVESINGKKYIMYRLKILDHNNEPSSSTPVPNVVPIGDETYTLLPKLELLFSSIYEEYFNEGHKGVSKSSALSDNLQQQDTQPRLIVQPTLELIIPPTDVNVEKNNTDQAEDTEFKAYNLSILLLHQEQKIPSPSHATLIL
ncbi:retrovirus-related pol polyprotein from transposon TNT 1-94 [Tanacetum coccineum]